MFLPKSDKYLLEKVERLEHKIEGLTRANEELVEMRHDATQQLRYLEKEKETALTIQAHNLNIEFTKQKQELEMRLLTQEEELTKGTKDEVVELNGEIYELQRKLAVAEAQLKLLKDALRTNEDILDVKDMVAKLIEKLPTIDLKSLTVNASSNGTTSS